MRIYLGCLVNEKLIDFYMKYTFLRFVKRFIRNKLIPFFYMLFYNTICKGWIELLGTHDTRDMKYGVSLCLIFKNEAPFLKEWIDYHITVGVDHFYLYNNNSDDEYLSIIQPYIEKGIITLIDWPEMNSQFKAYKHCYENFRHETNWISFLDADEFFVPKYYETIKEWLIEFDKYPAIMIHWRMVGTGGMMKHDYKKNVIEQYFACWEDIFPFGKCLINTRYDIADYFCWHVHHDVYMKYRIFGINITLPAVNQFRYICPVRHTWGGGKHKMEASTLLINHYYTKAWDIYHMKMSKTDVLHGDNNPRAKMDKFYQAEMKCIKRDYTIQRFFIKIKQTQCLLGL